MPRDSVKYGDAACLEIATFFETKEVPFGFCFGDFAAEDITIKVANAVPILSRNNDRRMITEYHLCQDCSVCCAREATWLKLDMFLKPSGYCFVREASVNCPGNISKK